jgi:hypothetical protein
VAITYRTTGTDPALPPRIIVRYFAAGDRLRIDGGPIGYLLVDRAMERVELVMPQPKLVLEMPPGGGLTDTFILGPDLAFRAVGMDHALGRACMQYDVTINRAHGRVCLSPDGLLLRGEGRGADGRAATIEAVAVSMAAQPAGLFSPPDTYSYIETPK